MIQEDVDRVVEHGIRHLEWCTRFYNIERNMGLYFLHEHPNNSRSWGNSQMLELMRKEGVYKVRGDMCTWGMNQSDNQGEEPIKKPTGFLTNPMKLRTNSQRDVRGLTETLS